MARKSTTRRATAQREYLIGATLRVRADSHTRAKQLASDALVTLAGDVICGAWIDREAQLFDPGAFAQIPGQLSISDD